MKVLIFIIFKIKIKILQVLHGCRQLVSWDVRLIPLTSETLIFNLNYFLK
jgi:hypothetical protein